MNRTVTLWVTGVMAGLASGCSLGPTVLREGRVEYNKALQLTGEEQLLLNLVRLKYRDSPIFLDVGAVSAQYSIDESGTIDGTIIEGATRDGRDVLNLGGAVTFSERPTISYSPLQGQDFVTRMLTPLPLKTLVLLTNAGWSSERTMRLTSRQINDLDNASTASGPTPEIAPEYEGFQRMARNLRELQLRGVVHLRIVPEDVIVSRPIAPEKVGAAEIMAAASEGYHYVAAPESDDLVLARRTEVPELYIPPGARELPAFKEFTELLGLDPTAPQYRIRETGDPTAIIAPPGERTEIHMRPQSLLGTMNYLSQAVEVPDIHKKLGFVTQTLDADAQPFDWADVMSDLLVISSSITPPVKAAVRVRYRDHYFYIDDADLNSKSTFALLMQMVDLQASEAAGGGPVLTLPIG